MLHTSILGSQLAQDTCQGPGDWLTCVTGNNSLWWEEDTSRQYWVKIRQLRQGKALVRIVWGGVRRVSNEEVRMWRGWRVKKRMKGNELESTFPALLVYTRGTAKYGSTYILLTLSGRQLTVLRGQVPEDIGWSTMRVVCVIKVLRVSRRACWPWRMARYLTTPHKNGNPHTAYKIGISPSQIWLQPGPHNAVVQIRSISLTYLGKC